MLVEVIIFFNKGNKTIEEMPEMWKYTSFANPEVGQLLKFMPVFKPIFLDLSKLLLYQWLF